jgi:DtxR family Mn-dependent transcriptional regulator
VKTSTPSSSIEDYVKVIYSFTEWQDKPITSSQLAQRLGVANSSVSEMVRKLKDQGLVDHKPYSAITLTTRASGWPFPWSGGTASLRRTWSRSWATAGTKSTTRLNCWSTRSRTRSLRRVAARLGRPARDPHGDPIPSADGTVLMPRAHLMIELDDGHTGRITRISDENPDLLRYLAAEEIDLDADVEIAAASPSAVPSWSASVPPGPAATSTSPTKWPPLFGSTVTPRTPAAAWPACRR